MRGPSANHMPTRTGGKQALGSASSSANRRTAALPSHPPSLTLLCPPCRFKGLFWKFARVGERLSPWVAVACFCMAFSVVFL